MSAPIDPLAPIESINQAIADKLAKAAQGVERGAAAAVGGAVHDFLGLPQATINIGYNVGGFILGVALIFVGAGMIIFHLFGDVIRDSVGELEDVIGGQTKTTNAVTKTAAGATIADTVAETATLL